MASNESVVDDIRRQVDFYFSEYALHFGQFFRNKLRDDEAISLEVMNRCKIIGNLTNSSVDRLREVCAGYGGFENCVFDPESGLFTRKEKFVFNSRFFSDKAALMLCVCPINQKVTPRSIQNKLEGVEFVNMITPCPPLSNDDVDDSGIGAEMSNLKLEDTEETNSSTNAGDALRSGTSSRPPYAKVYFKILEARQRALAQSAEGLYIEGERINLMEYKQFRSQISSSSSSSSLKSRSRSTIGSLRRTLLYTNPAFINKEQTEDVKNLFKGDGVVLVFHSTTGWYLFFESSGALNRFLLKIKCNTDQDDALGQHRFSKITDPAHKEYVAYRRVVRNFYRKDTSP